MTARANIHASAIAVLVVALGVGVHGCSDKKNPATPVAVGADVTIDILGNAPPNSYSPNPDTVTVGQTVSWRNMDTTAHTATEDVLAFGTGTINPGATSLPLAMNGAGTFPYHCVIHGVAMAGTLVVTP